MTDRSLSHLDPFGGTRMVDVSPKEATHRRALARCKVAMKPETTAKVANNAITKGDVLAAARVAGIQAAKRTADLVPMCHPLLVGAVHVDFTIGDDFVEVEAKVEAVDRTGVEMEAMTACAVAALTVYDMCKTTDRTMSIGQLMLWEKTGGTSGVWKREPLGGSPPERRTLPAAISVEGLVLTGASEALLRFALCRKEVCGRRTFSGGWSLPLL